MKLKSKIISNKKIKDNYFKIIIEAPEIAKYTLPGQFVNIKVNDGLEPLLRRPFSIHRVSLASCAMRHASKKHKAIVILYEIVGRGTEALSKRKPGEYLDVIGPLGNGFVLDARRKTQDARRILVAGGMGTAPLVFLAEKLQILKSMEEGRGKKDEIRGKMDEGRETIVLIGGKTKKDILCEKEFKELGCEVKIATDDGSRGFSGRVTELLEDILRRTTDDGRRTTICYGCGPAPMLKEISRISQKYNIPAQVSLEAHMACGIGACMGCVIKTRGTRDEGRKTIEYKRVCYEGPVFEANQILWE